VHRPHLIFKLGHDSTSVSASARTATQTPISVSSASIDRACVRLAASAVTFRRTAHGITAAWEEEIMYALNSSRMSDEFILSQQSKRDNCGDVKAWKV